MAAPFSFIDSLHRKVAEYITYDAIQARKRKREEKKKPKALPESNTIQIDMYKETSYRDMNCTHCGHLIASPVPSSGVTRVY